MKKYFFIIFILLIFFPLSVLGASKNKRFIVNYPNGKELPVIVRYDKELEVICFILDTSISCIPLSELSIQAQQYIENHITPIPEEQ